MIYLMAYLRSYITISVMANAILELLPIGFIWEGGPRNSLIFIKRKMWNWTKEFFFFLLNFSSYSIIYANVGCIREPLKQDVVFEFCREQNKDNSILTETHFNHDKIHQIMNNWLSPVFHYPRNIHTKGLLGQLRPGLEGVTEVDTNPKGRFVSFKITFSNNRVLCVCAPLTA